MNLNDGYQKNIRQSLLIPMFSERRKKKKWKQHLFCRGFFLLHHFTDVQPQKPVTKKKIEGFLNRKTIDKTHTFEASMV